MVTYQGQQGYAVWFHALVNYAVVVFVFRDFLLYASSLLHSLELNCRISPPVRVFAQATATERHRLQCQAVKAWTLMHSKSATDEPGRKGDGTNSQYGLEPRGLHAACLKQMYPVRK